MVGLLASCSFLLSYKTPYLKIIIVAALSPVITFPSCHCEENPLHSSGFSLNTTALLYTEGRSHGEGKLGESSLLFVMTTRPGLIGRLGQLQGVVVMFIKRIVAVLSLLIFMFGCGGGSMQSELPVQNYSRPGHQSPNYHPHASRSHIYWFENTMHIGGDVEPREKLRQVGTYDGFTVSIGTSRDGIGVNRLENYERDLKTENGTTLFSLDGFYPFKVPPKIWLEDNFYNLLIEDDENAGNLLQALLESIQILNDALPPEFQIDFTTESSYKTEGTIAIAFRPPESIAEICDSATAAACASSDISYLYDKTKTAIIFFPDNLDTSKRQTTQTIMLHELLHALGIRGHVDSIEFPDSLMGAYGDYFPNPGFVLHRIDREVLQIMYMSQRTDDYNDWGEWSDTTLHLAGESDDGYVHFGVALFNGLPQPWARGTAPSEPLSANTALTGSVKWEGLLLGFSGVSPIKGDAELTVQMSNLAAEQDLKFNDVYFLNKFEEHGSDRWFSERNIDYKVTMTPHGFYHSSNDGHVTGLFLGPEHEGMAGTIKRTDLVGAFGGTR